MQQRRGEELEVERRPGNIHSAGGSDGFARICTFGFGQPVEVLKDAIGNAAQDVVALIEGEVRPRRKGRAGCLKSRFDVFRTGVGDLAGNGSGGRLKLSR